MEGHHRRLPSPSHWWNQAGLVLGWFFYFLFISVNLYVFLNVIYCKQSASLTHSVLNSKSDSNSKCQYHITGWFKLWEFPLNDLECALACDLLADPAMSRHIPDETPSSGPGLGHYCQLLDTLWWLGQSKMSHSSWLGSSSVKEVDPSLASTLRHPTLQTQKVRRFPTQEGSRRPQRRWVWGSNVYQAAVIVPPVSTWTYVQPSKHMYPQTTTISLPAWSQWRMLQRAEHSRQHLQTSHIILLFSASYTRPSSRKSFRRTLEKAPFVPPCITDWQQSCCPAPALLWFSPLLVTCPLVSIHIAAVTLVECASVVLRVWKMTRTRTGWGEWNGPDVVVLTHFLIERLGSRVCGAFGVIRLSL